MFQTKPSAKLGESTKTFNHAENSDELSKNETDKQALSIEDVILNPTLVKINDEIDRIAGSLPTLSKDESKDESDGCELFYKYWLQLRSILINKNLKIFVDKFESCDYSALPIKGGDDFIIEIISKTVEGELAYHIWSNGLKDSKCRLTAGEILIHIHNEMAGPPLRSDDFIYLFGKCHIGNNIQESLYEVYKLLTQMKINGVKDIPENKIAGILFMGTTGDFVSWRENVLKEKVPVNDVSSFFKSINEFETEIMKYHSYMRGLKRYNETPYNNN